MLVNGGNCSGFDTVILGFDIVFSNTFLSCFSYILKIKTPNFIINEEFVIGWVRLSYTLIIQQLFIWY
jgi:hypothetical protein